MAALLATDPGFDAACVGFDLSQRHEPDVVIRASSVDEVRQAVARADTQGLELAVQATGHGIARPLRGGLLLDTGAMVDVSVDPRRRSARVGAGATWSKVLAETTRYGLAPLCGSAPAVGAVGYLLGGGLGPLGRRFGFGADLVDSVEMVTVRGDLVTTSVCDEPELFWGVRGAGANFGVVTEMVIQLVPVTQVYAGGLFFAGEHAGTVLAAFADATATAPDSLSLSVAFLTFPDGATVPAPLRGRFVAHLRVCQVGDPHDISRWVDSLRLAAPLLLDTVDLLPIGRIGSVHADPVHPMPVNCRSAVLHRFDSETLDTITNTVERRPPFLVELRHLGGALARLPDVPNAVGHRRGLMNVFTSAMPGGEPGVVRQQQDDFLNRLEAWSDGGALVNFLQGPHITLDDVRRAYDPDTWSRLTVLKTTWDPQNRLSHNRNVPPRTDQNADHTPPAPCRPRTR